MNQRMVALYLASEHGRADGGEPVREMLVATEGGDAWYLRRRSAQGGEPTFAEAMVNRGGCADRGHHRKWVRLRPLSNSTYQRAILVTSPRLMRRICA
jgi:hypothetical protein